MSRRPGTASDRDVLVRKTPPRGVAEQLASPHEVEEAVTGVLEGEELMAARRQRASKDPIGRIVLIETEQKVLIGDVNAIKLDVAEIRGDQKENKATLRAIEKAVDQLVHRESVKFSTRAKVDEAEQIDAIDARKAKRWFYAKIFAAVIGGGAIGKILNALGLL